MAPSKLQQAVGVLPRWNINKLIAEFGDNDNTILYYAEQIVVKHWGRDPMFNATKLIFILQSVFWWPMKNNAFMFYIDFITVGKTPFLYPIRKVQDLSIN